MPIESINLKIVVILTMGFSLAGIFGYLTQKMKLSPMLGYLFAGYLIGPFFPGFVADIHLAEQLAEVGVMLMMFGVGLHFKLEELLNVKRIAIPGAVVQTLVATLASTLAVYLIWGTWEAGIIIGLAIGVASTVVLVRVLNDHNLLHTLQGHIAVGWLIVEDILTVAVLILLPTLVALLNGEAISPYAIAGQITIVILKFLCLIAVMFTIGKRVVSYLLFKVAQTRSPELFTLAVLALTCVIAAGSAFIFGTSIALGAFIAGMVIGQTEVRHQASAYAAPIKDAFVVIFFLSVGMLFNPIAIVNNLALFFIILFIILAIKPLTAYLIVVLMRYPVRSALCVAFALAQIGEFSFILAEQATQYRIFPDEAFDIIVACALVSIAINPLFFKVLANWKGGANGRAEHYHSKEERIKPKALIVGLGSVEETILPDLEELGFQPVIVDRDVDKVTRLKEEKWEAVYGEATYPCMLKFANIRPVKLVIITRLDLSETLNIISFVQELYPGIPIIAQTKELEGKKILNRMGVHVVCEEMEMSGGLKKMLVRGKWVRFK